MADTAANSTPPTEADGNRRDFIFIATGAMGALGAAMVAWPFIDSMSPAADTRALATTDVDLTKVEAGQQMVAMVAGRPVFVRHRTSAEIAAAQRDDYATMKDPATDAERIVQKDGAEGKPDFLVVQANCTHLGCVPSFGAGNWGGWFCPCHGSQFDTAGRIRGGPAPRNLDIAPYVYLTDTSIRIG